MQKAFKDIVERLEEEAYDMEICEEQFDMNSPYFMDVSYKMVKMDDVKEIVNQVAEEYGKDNNVPSNEITSLDEVINRLQYKADNIKAKLEPSYFTECIDYLKSLPRCDDGWIPCSERLPEEDEKVIISTKTERVYVGVYTKRYGTNNREGFICDDGFMWLNTALAWKPYILPQPYVKGE